MADQDQDDDRLKIDTSAFIKLIERHPTIWNYNCHEYAFKEARNESWEKVCKEFVDDYDEIDEEKQELISSQLQRRWKTLRDGFSRYLIQRKKAGTGRKPRTYHYFNQLSFLLKLKRKVSNYPRAGSTSAKYVRRCAGKTVPVKAETKIQSIKEEIDESDEEDLPLAEAIQLPVIQPQPQSSNSNEFDGDKYFLLSLCNDFKQIPDEYKLSAKSEIIGVLKKYADMRNQWSSGLVSM